MADEVTYWIGVDGDYPTNPEFIDKPKVLEDQPYAIWAFRQDDLINYGYPYHSLVPDLVRITLNPVRQREYICVYDMLSIKQDFLTNGLAILDPTEATINEVINGEYSLTLTHPIDDLGKWRFIRESNIIKCQGQLFTIKRVEWNQKSETSGTVTAFCEHIFYQLNDLWIFGDDNNPADFMHCQSAMNHVMSVYTSYDEGEMYRFDYDWSSDWEWGVGHEWTFVVDGEGQTPVEKLIGSGGIIDEKGGELYRNNFHFSINERMENAEDNAFDLRFGANLCGLHRTVDTSGLALWLRLTDSETGSWVAVSYAGNSFPLFQFPHNIVRSQEIQYERRFYEHMYAMIEEHGMEASEMLMNRIYYDLLALWKNTCTPVICYEVDVKDLKNVYPKMTNHYQYRVGNSGTILDEMLGGKITLKITETVTDGITGEVKSIVFGSKNSFTRSAGYPLEFDAEPQEATYEFPLRDKNGRQIYDSRGKAIWRRGVINGG